MKYVKINKKYEGNISPYFAYIPHQFKSDIGGIDSKISVLVSSNIKDGILESQNYEATSIEMLGFDFSIQGDKILNVTEDINQKELINSIYETLKNNEHVFLDINKD